MSWMWAGSLAAFAWVVGVFASCEGLPVPGKRTEAQWEAARARMVREQLAGPNRDIRDRAVLRAMEKVPRHRFVPEEIREAAYDDGPLSIGYGQTISQPYVVAFMTERLELKRGDRVLEIGTGSGYQAAILAELAAEVYTIEIIAPLAERARATLADLGYTNIRVRAGDGYLGWPEAAPFDAIIATCAPDTVPPLLIGQLKDGGRMIIPVGPTYAQELVLLRKQGGRITRQAVLPVRFVPMTGRARENSPQPPAR
ncbi:MAG TPA: protein-L-isoaspartate(D-aspartate) O-methyltransferase [Opitutaceae bacterium]|nr:protein-L-isoaspartate(D-aspartate) O-methyltransferase [Opitutaceae bacterium]